MSLLLLTISLHCTDKRHKQLSTRQTFTNYTSTATATATTTTMMTTSAVQAYPSRGTKTLSYVVELMEPHAAESPPKTISAYSCPLASSLTSQGQHTAK